MRKIKNTDKLFAHMTIGSVYKALNRQRDTLLVRLSIGKFPGVPHQYQGNEKHIAFSPINEEVTVQELKAMCQDCMKMAYLDENNEQTYIQSNALVWIATPGRITNLAITDVVPNNGEIILKLDTPRTI